MVLMTVAFSMANYVLHPSKFMGEKKNAVWGDQQDFSFFVLQMYHASWLTDFELSTWLNSGSDVALYLCQSCFMLVVMLNLLIAIMGDTFARVKEQATVAYFEQLADVLNEIEGSMTPNEYQNEKWFPKYV